MKLSLFLNIVFVIIMCLCMITVSCNSSYLMDLKSNPHYSVFPSNFLFGTASSSYQFEGAYLSDGKGLSNWDIFSHEAGNILDGSNGDIAVDHYHRYLEDLDLMAYLGVNSYRFSISWARILPKGRFGKVNMAGIKHYNKLIDALLNKGISPFATLTHYDIPQELEERYGAWLSPEVHTGDSEKEPFIAAHNMILSHAAAASTYRTKYKKKQGGCVGIVMNAIWFEPFSNSPEDKLAAKRAQSFYLNWFLDPIIFGRYPAEMQQILGTQLPAFSRQDQTKIKSGADFIGINHYTSFYAKDCIYSTCEKGPGVSNSEGYYLRTAFKDGIPIGETTAVDWIYVYPQGMYKIVMYIKDRYNNTPMFITENGYGELNNLNSSIKDFLNDYRRVEYMNNYLDSLALAIWKGANVRGYFAWSLLDNFEWISGYTIRFGLHHVDYATLERTPKLSGDHNCHQFEEPVYC